MAHHIAAKAFGEHQKVLVLCTSQRQAECFRKLGLPPNVTVTTELKDCLLSSNDAIIVDGLEWGKFPKYLESRVHEIILERGTSIFLFSCPDEKIIEFDTPCVWSLTAHPSGYIPRSKL